VITNVPACQGIGIATAGTNLVLESPDPPTQFFEFASPCSCEKSVDDVLNFSDVPDQ